MLEIRIYMGLPVILAPLPQARAEGLQTPPIAYLKAYFNTN